MRERRLTSIAKGRDGALRRPPSSLLHTTPVAQGDKLTLKSGKAETRKS